MRSVTLILIYLAPLLICQPEIFGMVSDHVSGRVGIFFFVADVENSCSVFLTDDVVET